MENKVKVLFLCDGNNDLSQMAEGLLRKLGGGEFDAHSAGLDPEPINPAAISVMLENHIDIGGQHSKHLNEYMDQRFDYIITLCEKSRHCGISFPRDSHTLHWTIEEPVVSSNDQEHLLALFRAARDSLANQVSVWIESISTGK